MAAKEATKDAFWLKELAEEVGIGDGEVPLLCKNQSDMFLAKKIKFTRSNLATKSSLLSVVEANCINQRSC